MKVTCPNCKYGFWNDAPQNFEDGASNTTKCLKCQKSFVYTVSISIDAIDETPAPCLDDDKGEHVWESVTSWGADGKETHKRVCIACGEEKLDEVKP